jgi:SPP1 family predicted phage head-tail adaptor
MVIIQRLTSVPNGIGGYIEDWNNHLEYPGVLDQLTGNERLSAEKISPLSSHILIGPMAEIKEADRVIYNDRIYNIVNIDNPMNLNRHLEILLEFKGMVE